MGSKFFAVLFLAIPFYQVSFAQSSTPDESTFGTKTDDLYAEQKQISNDLAAKSALIPFTLPDPKSMISMNESGDGVISLPFVTAHGRKLTLPITLSYVTQGIKVDQNSSDVGLGWSISVGKITRDFGAFEPDYTFTGSEFGMPDIPGLGANNKKLRATNYSFGTDPITHAPAYVMPTDFFITPINQNKFINYNNVTGSAPDNYSVDIPGLGSNDFWNSNSAVDATSPTPSFIFSLAKNWLVTYEKKTFNVSQEVSRINELDYKEMIITTADPSPPLDGNGNIACAIGVYPYVTNGHFARGVNLPEVGGASINLQMEDFTQLTPSTGPTQLSPNMTVSYEDYSKFKITTDDGTQYVFGRSIRQQKYLFPEEPFWSTSFNYLWLDPSFTGWSGATGMSYGEFWKTDYISEWLLTEIHSNDYIDANSNGVADDGDFGDWIHIDYGDSIQCENLPALPTAELIPAHRDFLNYVETDRASGLMKECAYVSKITTPVQVIDFLLSKRFDVNQDYFNKPLNRYSENYAYGDRFVDHGSFPAAGDNNWVYDVPTSDYLAPSTYDAHTIVNYPIETMRYDGATVHDNISLSTPTVQNITLNYAVQGTSNQLAVSNYLILDNDGTTFLDYDPSLIGGRSVGHTSLDSPWFTSPYHSAGRGKTTLLGIDYRGISSTSDDKISYSFKYGNNPSYNQIHLRQIWNLAASTGRESRSCRYKRWSGIRTIVKSDGSGFYKMPNSILPWKTLMIDRSTTNELVSLADGIRFTSSINWGNPVFEDELGYYYNGSMPNQGRDAWCLSEIDLPHGGSINIQYEQDQFDINNDRHNWKLPDYCLPEIGYYNNIAINRSMLQQVNNEWELPLPSWYYPGMTNLPRLNNEYYYFMNSSSGGLRIKKVDFTDNFTGSTITKTYSYGTGHFTAPPADYWSKYMEGYSAFLYNEYIRHGNVDDDGYGEIYGMTPVTWTSPIDYSDDYAQMMKLACGLRVDRAYAQNAKHYYEYIQETNNDGSKTTRYYGALNPDGASAHPRLVYLPTKYGLIKNGLVSTERQNNLSMMSTDINEHLDLGEYKTEQYDNLGNLVKQNTTDFTSTVYKNNVIDINAVSMSDGDYFPFVPFWFSEGDLTRLDKWYTTGGADDRHDAVGLQGINGSYVGPFPSAYGTNIYDNWPSGLLTTSGYQSYTGDPNVQAIAEAWNPFTKMAAQCGAFTSMPSWFSNITSMPEVWSGTSDATMATAFKAKINSNIIGPNHAPWTDPTSYTASPHTYLIGNLNLTFPATNTSNQISKSLLPIHTSTTTTFH